MAVVSIADRLLDPSYWPKRMTLGDKLFRLRMMAPQDYRDIETLVNDRLERLRPRPRTPRKDRL